MQVTLNLADPTFSDISYTKTKYSDGQVNIVLGPELREKLSVTDPVFILTRFNNYEDLFYLLGATDVLRSAGYQYIYVGITCFLGQRSDQRFKDLQSFDLKIIADIINSQNYTGVIINEPHSAVLPALINRAKLMPPAVFFNFVQRTMMIQLNNDPWILVSPDAGAYKRTSKLAETYNIPMVAANKYRADDGSPQVALNGDVAGKNCVILDDYCDGGRTFISLAQQLKAAGAKVVVLAVVHGLYSYGLEPLMDGGIDFVISTNSIKTVEIVNDGMKNRDYTNYIFQQDVIGKQ